MICLLKVVVAYFILMFLSTNLLGFVVRGLVPPYKNDSNDNPYLAKEIASFNRAGIVVIILFIILSIFYYIILYHYWNIGVVSAAAMLMFPGIPDLLFEIRTGENSTPKNNPKKVIDFLCSTIFYWAALPDLWFSLC